MNVNLLFNCACFLTDCDSCPLDNYGCEAAPIHILLGRARKHYAEMKKSEDWERYNNFMTKYFGADYAKEFVAARVTVV